MNSPITIKLSTDFDRIKEFYISTGHLNAPQFGNQFVVAEDKNGKIVGCVRLCEEEDVLVLRTMEVTPSVQRQGIGTQMLAAFKELLGSRQCYCIAKAHLDSFYGQIGFEAISFEDAPEFLQKRITEYRARPTVHTKEFILMKKI